METSLLNRKNIITFLVIGILLLAIPLGLSLIQEQQKLKSKAASGPITFQGLNVTEVNGRQVFKLDDQGSPTVGLTLTSPFGEGKISASSNPSVGLICEVVSNITSGVSPLTVNLTYGARGFKSNSDYVTGVQWDFNGDGNWDTSFDSSNQHISHTYNQPGNNIVKMHLQTVQGLTSGVCTGNISVISSSLSSPNPSGQLGSGQIGMAGKVFLDNDKDGFFSSGDQAVVNTNVIMRKVGVSGDVLLPSGITDQNGQYEIDLTGLPAGDYMVSATLPSGLTAGTAYHHSGVVPTDYFTIINIPIRPL